VVSIFIKFPNKECQIYYIYYIVILPQVLCTLAIVIRNTSSSRLIPIIKFQGFCTIVVHVKMQFYQKSVAKGFILIIDCKSWLYCITSTDDTKFWSWYYHLVSQYWVALIVLHSTNHSSCFQSCHRDFLHNQNHIYGIILVSTSNMKCNIKNWCRISANTSNIKLFRLD